jgi:hypothetical protein
MTRVQLTQKLERMRTLRMTRIAGVLLCALVAPASATEVEDLVESCALNAPGTDRGAADRAGWRLHCLSYVQAFKDGIAYRGERQKFCIPSNLTHGEQVFAFSQWAKARQGTLGTDRYAVLTKSYEETYACTQ